MVCKPKITINHPEKENDYDQVATKILPDSDVKIRTNDITPLVVDFGMHSAIINT